MIRHGLRYAGVAGSCLVLHNLVLIGSDRAGVHYAAAALLSFAVVSVTGFLLHARLTFQVRPSAGGYARYAAAMALNLPLSVALLWLACGVFALPMWLAAPLSSGAMLLWNFVATRWALVAPSRAVTG